MTELSTQLFVVKSLWENFSDIQSRLEKISRDIFGPLASEVGWEVKAGEPDLNKLLRVLVLGEGGLSGDEKVISEAKRRYEQFIKGDHAAISPDLRSIVYKIVLKNADEDEQAVWDNIFDIYNDESFPMDQRIVALTAVGSTIKDKQVIANTLDLILNEKQIRTQDAWVFFRA